MNLLYLAHRIPYPPNKGDKIRSFNTVKYLAQTHNVWCACFVDDPRDFRYVGALRQYCREVVALPLCPLRARGRAMLSLAIDDSASEGFYHDPAMVGAVRDLSNRIGFDALLVFSSSMAQYARHVDAKRKVIDLCDLDSRKWLDSSTRQRAPKAWMLALEARRLHELECAVINEFDATILISPEEAQGWTHATHRRLHFVGNGVDLPPEGTLGGYDSRVVGFTGDMHYFPNEDAVCWFAEEVWPQVHGALPDARFSIVGRGPSKRVRQLEESAGIHVTGEVPEIATHLNRFQCAVAPLRIARGVQNKVLEAMAAARPVVATTLAMSGIRGEHNQDFVFANTASEMAPAIIGLLRDPPGCATLGRNARASVRRNHAWDVCLQALSGLLELESSAAAIAQRARPSMLPTC